MLLVPAVFGKSTALTQIDLPELLVLIRAPKIWYCSVSVSFAPLTIWSDLQNGCTQTSGHEETKEAVGFRLVDTHHETFRGVTCPVNLSR